MHSHHWLGCHGFYQRSALSTLKDEEICLAGWCIKDQRTFLTIPHSVFCPYHTLTSVWICRTRLAVGFIAGVCAIGSATCAGMQVWATAHWVLGVRGPAGLGCQEKWNLRGKNFVIQNTPKIRVSTVCPPPPRLPQIDPTASRKPSS